MTIEQRKNLEGGIFLLLFCLTIPAANWMIGHVGDDCSAERARACSRWRRGSWRRPAC